MVNSTRTMHYSAKKNNQDMEEQSEVVFHGSPNPYGTPTASHQRTRRVEARVEKSRAGVDHNLLNPSNDLEGAGGRTFFQVNFT